MTLATLGFLVALADEPAEVTGEPAFAVTVCLSDGQVLGGDEFTRDEQHASLRIGALDVDIPTAGLLLRSFGDQVAFVEPGRTFATCERLARPRWSPRSMRIYTLADGQRLYGTGPDTGATLSVTLFDDRVVHLPGDLVSGVQVVPRDDAVYRAAVKARPLSVAGTGSIIGVTLGVVVLGAIVIGGWAVITSMDGCSFFCVGG